MKDPYTIIKNPLSTEKAVRLMEKENKLVFIVNRNANKNEVRNAVEKLLNVKVVKINTLVTPGGRKKAYIQLSQENKAIDVATQLGLI